MKTSMNSRLFLLLPAVWRLPACARRDGQLVGKELLVTSLSLEGESLELVVT